MQPEAFSSHVVLQLLRERPEHDRVYMRILNGPIHLSILAIDVEWGEYIMVTVGSAHEQHLETLTYAQERESLILFILLLLGIFEYLMRRLVVLVPFAGRLVDQMDGASGKPHAIDLAEDSSQIFG